MRLLERAGKVDVYGLPFGEDVEGGLAGLAMAIAGGLGASEWEVHFGADGRGVDIEDACVDIPHGGERLADIALVGLLESADESAGLRFSTVFPVTEATHLPLMKLLYSTDSILADFAVAVLALAGPSETVFETPSPCVP